MVGIFQNRNLVAGPGRVMRVAAALVMAHLLAVLAMAASPELHEYLHHDADHEDHQCAVTDMLAGGNGDGSPAQPIALDAVILPQVCVLVEFDSPRLASLFLAGSVLEHAPPAII